MVLKLLTKLTHLKFCIAGAMAKAKTKVCPRTTQVIESTLIPSTQVTASEETLPVAMILLKLPLREKQSRNSLKIEGFLISVNSKKVPVAMKTVMIITADLKGNAF